MDDIKVLEEIGLKEVCKVTHIEVKNLQSIVDCDFKKLHKATAVGFIKIISREYKLDLSDWAEQANQYWDDIEDAEGKQKIFIVQKPKIFPKYILTIISIAILGAILYGAYVFLNQRLNFFETPLLKNDTNYTYEQTPVVNEAKKTLKTDEIPVDTTNQAVDVNTSGEIAMQNSNTNNSSFNDSVAKAKKEQNITKIDAKITQPVQTKEANTTGALSLISPNTKLWIGIIYLDNFKRKSFLGDGNFTLEPSREQLITTGHGDFNLYFKGKLTKFNSQRPMKFLIKDGNITEISLDKFKELNKGSLW
ncbi:MAG: hypothetical protein GXP61_02080 [Epsilonproteobacteria bacterium]|nr:hypothetical protein [Campylobacterota bacterium]